MSLGLGDSAVTLRLVKILLLRKLVRLPLRPLVVHKVNIVTFYGLFLLVPSTMSTGAPKVLVRIRRVMIGAPNKLFRVTKILA